MDSKNYTYHFWTSMWRCRPSNWMLAPYEDRLRPWNRSCDNPIVFPVMYTIFPVREGFPTVDVCYVNQTSTTATSCIYLPLCTLRVGTLLLFFVNETISGFSLERVVGDGWNGLAGPWGLGVYLSRRGGMYFLSPQTYFLTFYIQPYRHISTWDCYLCSWNREEPHT